VVVSLDAPSLLALAHPYALKNVNKAVHYVAKLREYVGSLPAGGEKEGTAKRVLVDLVDCSGVDFAALDGLLADCAAELNYLNGGCVDSLKRPVVPKYAIIYSG